MGFEVLTVYMVVDKHNQLVGNMFFPSEFVAQESAMNIAKTSWKELEILGYEVKAFLLVPKSAVPSKPQVKDPDQMDLKFDEESNEPG